MKSWKNMLLAGAIAVTPLSTHAFAAQKEAPAAEIVLDDGDDGMTSADFEKRAKERVQREIDQAMAMVEKMFDTSKLPPIDQSRLPAARNVSAALLPNGAMEKMLNNLYGQTMTAMLGEFGGSSDIMLSIKTGVDTETLSKLDAATKTKVADIFDPYSKQRVDKIVGIIRPLVAEALADVEPSMREGIARAYARQFSGEQLTEMASFFATPTGKAFANESMVLQADPEVMLSTIKAIPPLVTKFMDRGPEIEQKFKSIDIPNEKSLADLSDADLSKLAKLLGVSVKSLKERRDDWASTSSEAVDAAEAAADAAEAAADASDYAGYDRDNWSEADRKKVEDLEEALLNAQDAAIANAQNKPGKNKPTT